jgi:hypothetical protein
VDQQEKHWNVGVATRATVGGDSPSKYVSGTLAALGKQQTIGLGAFVTAQTKIIQTALAEHKVYSTPLVAEPLSDPATRAHFSPVSWRISVNSNSWPDPLSRDEAIELAGTIYHEARHAEQWFSMIRYVIFTQLTSELRKAESVLSVTLKIAVPDVVVAAAFMVSKKKNFDANEKAKWAEWLYTNSISPATPGKPAGLSPNLLDGEAGPHEKVPAYRAILAQQTIFNNPQNHQYPLAIDHWREWAPHAQNSWAECMLAVAPQWPVADLGPLPVPFTDAECGALLAMVKSNVVALPAGPDAAVANARDRYVQYYGKLLSLELKEAKALFEEAYRAYRALPVEQDAFATQDIIVELFKAATK